MSVDCMVIGGGSAGAMAAWLLAREGLAVELVEQRPRERAGASWHNDVEGGLFHEVGLGAPPPGVVVHEPPRFVMTTKCRTARQELAPHPAIGLDMPRMCAWLLEKAESAGAVLRFDTKARLGHYTGKSRVVHLPSGPVRVAAVVDARGLDRSVGEPGSTLHPILDVCNAHQAVHEISNAEGARTFLGEHSLSPDDVLCVAGVEHGYSVLHISVSPAHGSVSLLGAALPFPGRRKGRRIIEDFASEHPWVGGRLSGGGSLIPLRPPKASLVEDGLARIGDAAGQVFPSTGSGVALHLRAATMASRAIARPALAGDPVTAARLFPYDLEYHRGIGATCAAYQPLRYLLASLQSDDVRKLLKAGVVGSESIRAAYENQPFSVSQALLGSMALHLPSLAPLLPGLARAVTMGGKLERHYRRYPRSAAGLRRWSRRERALMKRAARPALEVCS